MGLLPHVKTLVKRLEHEPFRFIGMYGREGDPKEIARRMQQEGITWRNAMDLGEAGNTLWGRWAVRGFPQIYLLDADGVIRQRWFGNPGEEVLDREIEALIAEHKAKQSR